MLHSFNILKKPQIIHKKPEIRVSHRALVGDTTVAECPDTVSVEGNQYFPPESVDWDLLEASERAPVFPWKGVAKYYDLIVDGQRLPADAWSYKSPSDAASTSVVMSRSGRASKSSRAESQGYLPALHPEPARLWAGVGNPNTGGSNVHLQRELPFSAPSLIQYRMTREE